MADIFEAIQTGDAARVKELVGSDASLASAKNANGLSAVVAARYTMRREVLDAVLAVGPELDIFEAAAVGNAARVTELLASDPELVRAWSVDGFTALHLACFFGQEEIAKTLVENGADVAVAARNPMQVAPLHSAAAGRKVAIVKMLLEHGAPANARQQGGWTALHAAAQNGDSEMERILLERGADPAATNDAGLTAEALRRMKNE